MKTTSILLAIMSCFFIQLELLAQKGKMTTIPPSGGSVSISQSPTQNKDALPLHEYSQSNFSQEINTNYPLIESSMKAGINVNIGRNFGANNMAGRTPMDNTIAISNDGFIISADNRQVDYYRANGDTIKQFVNVYSDFYAFSGFTLNSPFDPKVIYDKYNDRFILAVIDHRRSNNSCIYLSFSKNNTPSDSLSWNHYKLPIDSTHLDSTLAYWYDYINIAVNKDELFITSNVFINDDFKGNALWQINKQEGYDSLNLVCRTFSDITNYNSTEKAFTLVPLSESLQSESYSNGCFLVNNWNLSRDSLFWYRLEGGLSDTVGIISKHGLETTPYNLIPYSSQPGGDPEHRIKSGDVRVQSGFYQNGKLHFVYVRNNLDWGQIVYSRINTSDNTEERNTWGIVNKNYLYPSIASFSNDTITEDVMICFQRVGPSEYPQVCVVNYNNGWSPNSTVVKDGEGLLDFLSYDGTTNTYERWGDYTGIQRRYNEKACWLVGSYAFGDTTNLGGSSNFLNAWIAEVGSDNVSIEETSQNTLIIYPNPVKINENINLSFSTSYIPSIKQISITDVFGQIIPFERIKNTIYFNNNKSGIYFLTIQTINNELYTQKLVVQ